MCNSMFIYLWPFAVLYYTVLIWHIISQLWKVMEQNRTPVLVLTSRTDAVNLVKIRERQHFHTVSGCEKFNIL